MFKFIKTKIDEYKDIQRTIQEVRDCLDMLDSFMESTNTRLNKLEIDKFERDKNPTALAFVLSGPASQKFHKVGHFKSLSSRFYLKIELKRADINSVRRDELRINNIEFSWEEAEKIAKHLLKMMGKE